MNMVLVRKSTPEVDFFASVNNKKVKIDFIFIDSGSS